MHRRSQVALTMLLTFLTFAATGRAQAPAPRGKLIVTVVDPSRRVIPEATVTIAGLEDGTKTTVVPPAKTTPKGVVTFEGLAPGRYSIRRSSPDLKLDLLRDIRVNRGDNKHVVVLPLQNLTESVTVASDVQAAAADRASNAFGLTVTQEQIEALSDDPAEMAAQIIDIAGPGHHHSRRQLRRASSCRRSRRSNRCTSRAISSRPKPSSRDRRSSTSSRSRASARFAATANFSFRDGSMSAKSQFTETKGPEQFKGFGFNVGGASSRRRATSRSRSTGRTSYTTPQPERRAPERDARFDVLDAAPALRQRQHQRSGGLRAHEGPDAAGSGIRRTTTSDRNLGIGDYDLPERAFASDNNALHVSRARGRDRSDAGCSSIHGSTMSWRDFGSSGPIEAPTIVVQDAFTQRRRAAGRPRARQEHDVRVGRGLHPGHSFVARRHSGLCRLVPRQSQQQLPRHVHLRRQRRVPGGHAAALHAEHRRSAAQLLPRADRRVLPGRHPRPRRA